MDCTRGTSRGTDCAWCTAERCPAFLTDREVLERLVTGGALCSITASALTGRFGRDVKRFALDLVADGMVHNAASDAHGPSLRRANARTGG